MAILIKLPVHINMSRLKEERNSVSHERIDRPDQSNLLGKPFLAKVLKNLGCMMKEFILLNTEDRITSAEGFPDWGWKKSRVVIHMQALTSKPLLERVYRSIQKSKDMTVLVKEMIGVIFVVVNEPAQVGLEEIEGNGANSLKDIGPGSPQLCNTRIPSIEGNVFIRVEVGVGKGSDKW